MSAVMYQNIRRHISVEIIQNFFMYKEVISTNKTKIIADLKSK